MTDLESADARATEGSEHAGGPAPPPEDAVWEAGSVPQMPEAGRGGQQPDRGTQDHRGLHTAAHTTPGNRHNCAHLLHQSEAGAHRRYRRSWEPKQATSILFYVLFHYGSSNNTKYSCVCYTVGPCLSILHVTAPVC